MSRTSAVAVVAGSLVAGLLLSGCNVSLSSKKDASSTPTPTPTPTTSAPSTPAPTSSAPASPTESVNTAPLTITQRLLATHELPTLTQGQHWTDPGATSGAGTTPFGLCQRVDLGSIGATRVVQRLWLDTGHNGDSAAEQVAEFPDVTTAQRVRKVLLAWHNSCAKSLTTMANPRVRPVNEVGVPAGTGGWYLVSYAAKKHPDEGRFHAFGYVVVGKRLAILRMDNAGQDYNYPPGREPMVTAVKAAAEKLG